MWVIIGWHVWLHFYLEQRNQIHKPLIGLEWTKNQLLLGIVLRVGVRLSESLQTLDLRRQVKW